MPSVAAGISAQARIRVPGISASGYYGGGKRTEQQEANTYLSVPAGTGETVEAVLDRLGPPDAVNVYASGRTVQWVYAGDGSIHASSGRSAPKRLNVYFTDDVVSDFQSFSR